MGLAIPCSCVFWLTPASNLSAKIVRERGRMPCMKLALTVTVYSTCGRDEAIRFVSILKTPGTQLLNNNLCPSLV